MNTNFRGKGMVLVISPTESFLAKSLVTKLESCFISSVLIKGESREISGYWDRTGLIILFTGERVEEMSEMLMYIKDMAKETDKKILIIGYEEQYESIRRIVPENMILDLFKRPLVMDDLIKCIQKYNEEKTKQVQKKTILIVDDDITYMRTVYEWLKDSFSVGMASNGVQAIKYLDRNKVDLVLLDYEMPIANGPQVLKMLKSDSDTGNIPVMFLTGHSDRETVMSVIELNPADYLLKTIDRYTLLKKINGFFNKAQET